MKFWALAHGLDVFDDMCMATFASEYRVLPKNEKSAGRIKLKNNLGFI